jgi:hypothetical protein
MRSATRVGLVVILLAGVAATSLFFLRRPPSVQYAGSVGSVAATVSLRLEGVGAAPQSVTLDLGNGVRLVANRLP